jgi:hypothetical protein
LANLQFSAAFLTNSSYFPGFHFGVPRESIFNLGFGCLRL